MKLTAIVPTLGMSRHLVASLTAVKRDAGESAEVILTLPISLELEGLDQLADRVVRVGEGVGFAGACNAAISATTSKYVALINDDAIVQPQWVPSLIEALESRPRAAAAQGVNLQLEEPGIAEGCGLAWNRAWQAVQLGRGERAPATSQPIREIFGTSATAAIFRRDLLEQVAAADGEVFDSRLGTYYEDVDLAWRLQGAGYRALLVPRARAHHAGSVTGSRRPRWRCRQIYSNRYLVVAKHLGRRFWFCLPTILARDLRDLGRAVATSDRERIVGISSGWLRAGLRLARFAHFRHPTLAGDRIELYRTRAG